MKIAITAGDARGLESTVFQHFGRTPYFVFVTVENNEITRVEGLPNPFAQGHQPGDVPGFIQAQNANAIISGGMGRRAIMFFEQLGIKAVTGGQGTVQQALTAFLGGDLTVAEACEHSLSH